MGLRQAHNLWYASRSCNHPWVYTMHPMLTIAIKAVRRASRLLIRYIDSLDQLTVSEKGSNDLVTQADQQAEVEIIDTIRHAYPSHAILSEEAGAMSGDDCRWIIDPLDGTTNFVHGFTHFAISIAMEHRGQLEVAVVYDPIQQEMFTACRGQGAQLNQRRIRVSQATKLKHALIGTGFPYRDFTHMDEYLAAFSDLLPKTHGIRRAGSAALDLAYVACGRLDGYWEADLKSWDIAAGALLVKEAGGFISDFRGEANYLQSGNVVTGNSKVYRELFEIVKTHHQQSA